MKAGVKLTTPVPSKTLLRYLRSQSDSVFFCVPSTLHSPPRGQAARKAACTNLLCRQLTTGAPNQGRGQSSYLDDLWPRHRDQPQKGLPPPRHFQTYPSHEANSQPHQHSRRQHAFQSWRRNLFRRLRAFRHHNDPAEFSESDYADVPFNSQQYEDTSAQLFNLSRTLSRNPSGSDQKLRCTEFDANGNVTLVSGEFKKSELIAKYGLLPRDLRKIDSSVLPHILVRPTAILINLLHLRVLIQSDRVLVFDAYGSTDSYTQSLFMYDLEGKLRQKHDPRSSTNYLPYELRALEAVLISATSGLEAEFTLVRDPVVRVLRALESDIDRDKLRHLLIHSKKLGTFEQKARLVRDAINDLLEADDDLAAMYLTERKQTGKSRAENDHQEVEMLLESYHKICDEIVEISGNLISNIRNTEEVVRAILDSNRNQLMLLDLKFSIGTLGLAGGTLIAGLYGMNLENFIEESEVAFGGITAICFGLSALICVYGMRRLRILQKVRMWGEGPNSWGRPGPGGGNWRNEVMDSAAAMLKGGEHQQRAEKLKRLREAGLHPAAAHGAPVLWPGMEGLGMHKLDAGRGDTENTNSSSSSSSSDPLVTIHDDIAEKESKAILQQMKRNEKGLAKSDKTTAATKGH